MLSRNNQQEQIKKFEPKKQRFTIKKLSVGVASVLLGFTFAETASADTTTNTDTNSNSDPAAQADHESNLASTSTSTLRATTTAQTSAASATAQNPAGDVQAPVASEYEAAVSSATSTANSSSAVSAASASSAAETQTFNVDSADLTAMTNKAAQTSLINWGNVGSSILSGIGDLVSNAAASNNASSTAAQGTETTDVDYNSSDYKTVTSFSELNSALADYSIKGVNVKGNISPSFFGTLNINRDFTIHGIDGAVLNLGNSPLTNNGNLTLDDITVNGSILGNGTVTVKGTVNSNVNAINATTLTKDQLNAQIGRSSGLGVSTDSWKAANIFASRVNIEQGAALNINRTIVGDGIALTGGAATFMDDGSTFGKTVAVGDKGTVDVGINAKLTINLKDANYATRSNEDGTNIENASAGIRATNNGHVVTGDSAEVTINAGHGRAIVFNEPFGGNSNVHPGTNQMLAWYNNRNVSRSKSYAQDTNNSVVLGDSTKLNITGRDGILMGNRSLFQTGNHSIVHIDSKGNGAGLLGDAFSVVEVSPQSQLILTSDGKDGSGMYAGGNFIGLGENGQFRVEHDATFRYRMTNRGGKSNFYDDNMNIISINTSSHPEVYVGTNATFDGQSDYRDYYGEIFSFPLGSTRTVFQIDGAKYVNWEKTAEVIGHSGHGNLYYSMGKGLIDATSNLGRSYYVFKWYNKDFNGSTDTFDSSSEESVKQSLQNFINTSSEYWQNVTHLATSYSKNGNTAEFPGHYVSSIDMNGDVTPGMKHGTPLNDFKGGNDGFDPQSSQRLVLVATIIPVQEDKTEQVKDPFQVKIRENDDLEPGEVRLIQKGVDGLKRVTTTTYYNLDPSSGKKTLDTSKGDNGVTTTTTILNKEQDEIIEVGPQTATVKYLYQSGSNESSQQPIQVNGQDLQAAITAIPVATDSEGNIIFNADGQATANTIDYDDASDLQQGKEAVSKLANVPVSDVTVLENQWQTAVDNGTNKYNVQGLTRDAIISAAEKAGLNNATTVGPTQGPNYNVVLGTSEKEVQGSVTYIDKTTGKTLDVVPLEGKVGQPIDYSTADPIANYEKQGYKLVSNDFKDGDETYQATGNKFEVVLEHTYDEINSSNPHGQNVTATVTRTVNYTVDGQASSQLPAKTESADFSASGYWDNVAHKVVDVVNGQIVVENGEVKDGTLTWTPDQATLDGYAAPTLTGYHVDSVKAVQGTDDVTAANVNSDGTVSDVTVNHQSNNIVVTINLTKDGSNNQNEKDQPVSQTIHFVNKADNKPLHDPDVTTDKGFHYSGDVFDAQTGEQTQTGSWDKTSHTFKTVKVPVIKGYVAVSGYKIVDGEVVAGGLTATLDHPNVEETVYYMPVGKIIPVDPQHQPIKDAPTPAYINNPDNPTEVEPNEPTPKIDGWHTDTKTVTPVDPTKDTEVVYTQDEEQKAQLTIVDQDNDNKVITVDGVQTTFDDSGAAGAEITFTGTENSVKELEDRGYVYVSTNFTTGDTFDDDTDNVQSYQIVMKHGTQPVNPENPGKPGQPINPNDPDGPKYPTDSADVTKTVTRTIEYQGAGDQTPSPVTQSVDFTASGVLDKVTGDWITPLTWSGDQTVDEVTSPTISDYHVESVSRDADGDNVAAATLNHNDNDYTVVVTYAADGEETKDQQNIPSTQTVKYVDEDGNELSPAKVQTSSFNYTGNVYNKTTGALIKEGTWNQTSYTYKTETVPVIDGYVAVSGYTKTSDGYVAGGLTATTTDPNVTATVVYKKIGKIVPVDPQHQPIPDAPTPSYKNDPNDPTQVTPDEKVPEVPGYTPETPTVTPNDPTKDTQVIYTPEAKDQSAEVIYQDVNDPNNIVQLATSGTLTGKAGTVIDYSTSAEIQKLEDEGYVLVNNGFPADATYDSDDNKTQTYYVTFKHGTQPVNPENPGKPGEPINPNDPDGPKYPADSDDVTKTVTRTIKYQGAGDETPATVTQSVDFTASGVLDKVTGNWITPLTWSGDQTVAEVTSPTISDYHVESVSRDADGTNVAQATLNHTDSDYTVVVTYAADGEETKDQQNIPSSQTVKFVDENGNELKPAVKDTADFIYSGNTYNKTTGALIKEGAWNETSHTYGTINVPVIDGYVAVSGYTKTSDGYVAGGLTATTADPDVVATVVYHKVGQIVPVDPEHNPIPDAPTPGYKNDPDDPTQVTPNEPTPTVPGYTPETPTITPGDPTEDTPVVYNPEAKDQNAEVIYQDVNDPDNPVQLATSGILTGKAGTTIDYSTADEIKTLEDEGYVLVNNGFPTDATYDSDDNKTQTFYVTFKHGTQPVNPETPGKPGQPINPNDPDGPKYPADSADVTKTVTRTIEYQGAGDQTPTTVTQSVDFTASGILDKVTGQWITPLTWSGDQAVAEVTSPTIPDYHVESVSRDADGTNVAQATLNHTDSNYTVVVTYAADGEETKDQQNIPSTQTVKYVDEDGNELSPAKVQTSSFNYTGNVYNKTTGALIKEGTWNQTSYTYKTETVPVIDGYVAVSGYTKTSAGYVAGGLTATTTDPNVTATVVYAKIGKIVPVDPQHQPIPDAPTPSYKNDPNDPTQVTPNEPTPTVPGYTPETPTVTPGDPTKDTQVIYNPVNDEQTAVVNYVDQDNNDAIITSSGDLTGKPGTKIDYSTTQTIDQLEDKGYVLVSNGFPADATFDDDSNTTQVFTVVFKHGTQPVNPENPGKPGEPINPNDPDGPKYPQDSADVTATVTRTIRYVDENGDQLSKPVEQTAHFTAEGEIDKVTGQWISPLTWSGDGELSGVKTPVVPDYHVVRVSRDSTNNLNVDPTTVNHETKSYTVTVTYAKNGKIVPVDPDGQPIPDAPTPTYPTDPDDPAKVTPDEPVPTIPGYTPSTPTVTPEDPGKDTTVVYRQNVNGSVAYIDDTTGKTMAVNTFSGVVGDPIDYSTASKIADYEAQGYVFVSSDFVDGHEEFKANGNNFTVHFKHGTQPVTPDEPGKPGEPINPNDPDGPKYPADSADVTKTVTRTIEYQGAGDQDPKTVTQSVDFTASGTLDKVTGQWITPLTWSGDQTVAEVTSPTISGYHVASVSRDADGDNVAATTISHNDSNYTVVVTYAADGEVVKDNQTIPSSQTIKFVDSDGNEIKAPVTETADFIYSGNTYNQTTGALIKQGSWNETSHTYGTVAVPVIDGYVAVAGYMKTDDGKYVAGGLTATTTDPNVTATVVYQKIGQIVPVDPSHNPIPDVTTPTYKNDPNNPTAVTPDEPVPTIPGYTPSTPTVTPEDPTKDTTVVYTPEAKDQNAEVIYQDINNPDNPVQLATSGILTGKAGTTIDYSTANEIKTLEDEGYVLVNNGFPTDATYDSDDNKTQTFYVTFKHGTQPVNPENPGKPGEPINPNDPEGPKYPADSADVTKTVTRTIKYVDQNGDQISTPVVQTAHFTGEGELDKVTGDWIKPITWSGDGHLAGVTTPTIEGYKVISVSQNADGTNVAAVTVEPTTTSYTVTVTYTKEDTVTPVTPHDESDRTAEIRYIDQSDNDKVLLTNTVQGQAGAKIDYSTANEIKRLEDQGYVLVKDGFPTDATFDKESGQTQVYTVVLKHGTAPVGPQNPHEPGTPINPNDPNGPKWPAEDDYSRTYTSTVNFVDQNGDTLHTPDVQTSTWTRTLIIDKVTGEITNPDAAWTPNEKDYQAVDVPVITGYIADKSVVPAKTTVQRDLTEDVVYHQIGKIVPVDPNGKPIPGAPSKPYVNDPNNPTKVVPNEEVPSVPGMTPEQSTVTPSDPTVDTPVVYTTPTPVISETPTTSATPVSPAETSSVVPVRPAATATTVAGSESQPQVTTSTPAGKLPQTGNETGDKTAALGLAALGLSGMLALGKKRKRE